MITARGKTLLKRFLVGDSGDVIGGMSIGAGDAPVTINDKRMQFEIERIPITITDFDHATDRLVFKGALSEDVSGTIYEVALWSSDAVGAPGGQPSQTLVTFDEDTEAWDSDTFEDVNVRIGSTALKHTPTANQSSTSTMSDLNMDLSDYSAVDSFLLAYRVDNSNTSQIKLRMLTDENSYYQFSVNQPLTGYHFDEFGKGSALVVGSPSWSDITGLQVVTEAKSSGSASVSYDGLRIEDMDTLSPEYGLVARHVLDVPIVKAAGRISDFEYSLKVEV